jgi:hypothetical protein
MSRVDIGSKRFGELAIVEEGRRALFCLQQVLTILAIVCSDKSSLESGIGGIRKVVCEAYPSLTNFCEEVGVALYEGNSEIDDREDKCKGEGSKVEDKR